MGFPSREEIEKVLKKLENVEPSHCLPENPTKAEVVKYELCKRFVIQLIETDITDEEMAEKLDIKPDKLNKIIRYRIDLFTVDQLLDYAEKLGLKVEVLVK
jgi:predicted XRE-type DNA-binding protein